MKSDSPRLKKVSSLLRLFSPVFWFGLIAGTVFAVASYIFVLFPKNYWMRSSYLFDVEHDTFSAFGRRFLLGAAGGAVIGLLHVIRELCDKKKGQDDDV